MTGDEALRERLRAERDERRRIAEALHDGPVQHVAALTQMVDAVTQALRAGDAVGAEAIAVRALEVAREAAAELREVVGGLEPASLDEVGLPGALHQLAERTLARRGVVAELDVDEAPPLGPNAASGLFQLAREAVDQAVRRGPPTTVRVALRATTAGGLTLEIADDGAPERRQAVLDGLGERAEELNATFAATREGSVTVVRVVVPPSAAAL